MAHRYDRALVVSIIALAVSVLSSLPSVVPWVDDLFKSGPSASIDPIAPPVGYEVSVTGSASGIAPEEDLWLVVRPSVHQRFYPQQDFATVSGALRRGGSWRVESVQLGERDQPPGTDGTYSLSVYRATSHQSQAFIEYLRTAADKGSPGLMEIDSGLDRLASIEVQRTM